MCGDEFSNNSADAACRDMGYSAARSWRIGKSWGDYRIALDDMNCTEGHFSSCSHTTSHNCVHGQDIFISCTSTQYRKSETSDGSNARNTGKQQKPVVTEEAGENMAIAILTLVCTLLVFLLVKKNSQIDQKDLQIAELLKRTDKLLEKIDHLNNMVTTYIEERQSEFRPSAEALWDGVLEMTADRKI